MSTYLYLECLDHDPPLTSDREVGQHLTELPRIRRDIGNRWLFIANARAEIDTSYDYFTGNAAAFLIAHPSCRIGIFDEYGVKHPIEAMGWEKP